MFQRTQIAAWLVTEEYEYSYRMNPPCSWSIEPVSLKDDGTCLFFRDGKVIGTALGVSCPDHPTEEDVGLEIIFILTPDGDADGNNEYTWAAFSSKEKAEAWVASRKMRAESRQKKVS